MKRGFTLTETLVTIAIMGLVSVGVGGLLRTVFVRAGQQPLALNSIDDARAVTTAFTNEIRSAAFGNDGSYPINQASSTQIIFFSPFGSPSSTTILRYRYYISNGKLYKGRLAPTGSPPIYNTANESVVSVLNNASAASTSAVFFYYDGSFNNTTSTQPLAQPVNITRISYVQIGVRTLLNELRNSTTTFSMITGATVRNLKTNLGN